MAFAAGTGVVLVNPGLYGDSVGRVRRVDAVGHYLADHVCGGKPPRRQTPAAITYTIPSLSLTTIPPRVLPESSEYKCCLDQRRPACRLRIARSGLKGLGGRLDPDSADQNEGVFRRGHRAGPHAHCACTKRPSSTRG